MKKSNGVWLSDLSHVVHRLSNRRFTRSRTSVLEEAIVEAREVSEVQELAVDTHCHHNRSKQWRFLGESSKRLANRHKIFTEGVEQVGISCLKSNAGIFCWMDLRSLLKEATVEVKLYYGV
uniref:Putative 1-aminocyclopropane-1-carboxylate synthase n=1 Tax=Davidia involucrata TaxID=16924 RepID=A0A5B6YXW0_DAVIN